MVMNPVATVHTLSIPPRPSMRGECFRLGIYCEGICQHDGSTSKPSIKTPAIWQGPKSKTMSCGHARTNNTEPNLPASQPDQTKPTKLMVKPPFGLNCPWAPGCKFIGRFRRTKSLSCRLDPSAVCAFPAILWNDKSTRAAKAVPTAHLENPLHGSDTPAQIFCRP